MRNVSMIISLNVGVLDLITAYFNPNFNHWLTSNVAEN